MSAELVILIMVWIDLVFFCCVVYLEIKDYRLNGEDTMLLFGMLMLIHIAVLIGYYLHLV